MLDFSQRGRVRGRRRDVQRRRRVPQEARGHDVPLATWPRRTRSTPRAAAPTRCARCCRAGCRPTEFTGKRLYEVMDLCLECKGCKAECPANVDMAKMKYEFLHHYYKANGLPLRNRLFGRIARLNALRLAHAPARQLDLGAGAQPLAHGEGGGHRPAAPAARPGRARRSPTGSPHGRRRRRRRAARWCCSTTRSSPTTRRRSARPPSQLLEAAGYRVVLVDRKCCGRPLISKGMLDEARDHAALERRAAAARTPGAASPSSASSPRASSRCATSTVDLLRTDEARAVAQAERSCSRSSCCASASGGSSCRWSHGHGAQGPAARPLPPEGHGRVPRPRWPRSSGPATR